MARQQRPDERLTRSQYKRGEAKRRRREEARWAARSGPVTVRHDPELAWLAYLDTIAPAPRRG